MAEALGQGGTSFDALYVNVNGGVRLLRPLAARLRARGRALRPVRHADPADRVHEPVVVLLPGLPAPPAPRRPAAPGARIDPGRGSVGLLKTAQHAGTHPQTPEGSFMAKALIGYLNSDLRIPARLTADNARLRARVGELEDLVLRLKEENDALAGRPGRRAAGPRHRRDGSRWLSPARRSSTGDGARAVA